MLSIGKLLLGFLAIGLSASFFWLFSHRAEIISLRVILANYYAKELCTCLVVLDMKDDYCIAYSRQVLDFDAFEYDTDRKQVTVKLFGHVSHASFQQQNLGCSLD